LDSWLHSGTRDLRWVVAVIALECALLVSMVHSQGLFRHVGMDFMTTYTAADMLAHGERRQLYNTRVQWERERPIIDRYHVRWDDRVMHPYTSPPQLALLGIPLLLFSPAIATLIWIGLGLLAVALAVQLLAQRLNLDGRLVAALVFGSFPMFYIVLLGQVDGFLFLAFVVFVLALRSGHEGRGGLALAAFALKPPLLPAALVFLFVTGRKRAFWTTIVAGGAQAAVGMALVGRSGIHDYIRLSRRLAVPTADAVTNVGGMINLRAMLVRALPTATEHALTLAIASATALTLVAAGWLWRRAGEDALGDAGLALLAATTVLTAYHGLYHTGLLAVLAVVLLANRAHGVAEQTRRARVLAVGWAFFTLGPLALFLVVPTAKFPAMLSSVGLLVVWGIAAYALALPEPRVAPTPLAAQAHVRVSPPRSAWPDG
jgi:hypothetical protein